MKKTILSVAILLASTLGMTAMAQTPETTQQTKTECVKGRSGKQMNRPNPFEGLNLTEQQKSELQALRQEMKNGQKPGKGTCEKAKAGKCEKAKAGKCEKAKADNQAKRAERRQAMTQARRDYLAKVKNILTPEQYVQFLENNYVDQAFKGGNHRGKMAQVKGHKGHKGHGKARGERGDKMRRNNNSDSNANANGENSAYWIDNGKIKVFPYHASNN